MTCAMVWPLLNLTFSSMGFVSYSDMGEYIRYERPVPAVVVLTVEHMRGHELRVRCGVGA